MLQKSVLSSVKYVLFTLLFFLFNPSISQAITLEEVLKHQDLKQIESLILEHSDLTTKVLNSLDGSKLIHLAAQNGNYELLKALIDYGVDINTQNYLAATPLHYAANEGHENCVQLLINHGADVNSQTDHLLTPLHVAIQKGKYSVAKILINKKTDINKRDFAGKTPLFYAVSSMPKIIDTLIQQGGDVNILSYDQVSPLHKAAYKGDLEIVKTLLKHGANKKIEDNKKLTPYHIAKIHHPGNYRLLFNLLYIF